MPRLNALADVLFPVEMRPVFAGTDGADGRRLLVISDKKAIVDAKRERVLGVVSRDYRLVTNREALDWAYRCCRAVFPDTVEAEWEVSATDAPATGGHCFIDLVHNSTALDFSAVTAEARPDAFGPFIRVTNSYNGLRALSFDIGFFRKVCKNGMILPDTIITFKFTHLRRDIGETIQFYIAHERLAHVQKSFGSYIEALRVCPVPREQFGPLVRAVLGIRTPTSLNPESRDAADWGVLTVHIADLADRYTTQLGENAYAVLNAVTEFASHPPLNRYVRRERHGLQRRAGTWVTAFSKRCSQPAFDLFKYLSQTEQGADTEDSSRETDYPRAEPRAPWYRRRLGEATAPSRA